MDVCGKLYYNRLEGVERPEVYSMYLYRSNIIHRNTARFCMDAKEVDHLGKSMPEVEVDCLVRYMDVCGKLYYDTSLCDARSKPPVTSGDM